MITMSDSTRRTLPRTSPLTALAKFESQPTLAEIAAALYAEKSENKFWKADHLFGQGNHYRLWRKLATPRFRPETLQAWGNASAIAQQGLPDGGDIQAWGI